MSQIKAKANRQTTDYLVFGSAGLVDSYTDFMLSRQSMLLSKRTIEFYSYLLGDFIKWSQTQHINEPTDITARLIRQFLFEQSERGLSDYTIHGYARSVRAYVHFLANEGYIPAVVRFDMPKIKKRRLPSFDAEDVVALLEKCNVRETAVIMFMVDTGVRLTEMTNIRQCDFNMTTGKVKIIDGKGGKDRTVIAGVKVRRAIIAYYRTLPPQTDPTAALFQTAFGSKFTRDGLAEFFKRLSRKTGIRVSAHALRRTFAILSLRAGMSPLVVQDLMGHADLTMTKHYAQMVDDDLLQSHREHSPIDNLKKLK